MSDQPERKMNSLRNNQVFDGYIVESAPVQRLSGSTIQPRQRFNRKSILLLLVGLGWATFAAPAQAPAPNYDESKVPPYWLPDPFVTANGIRVTNTRAWERQRRPETLKLFEEQVYGRAPGRPRGMTFEVTSLDRQALNGQATRKEVTIWFTGRPDGPSLNLLLYLPNDVKGRVPAFLGLNFGGNHTIHSDPGIRLSDRWMASRRGDCVTNNLATEACRGIAAGRWPVELILSRGYALATVYCGDLEPDFEAGWKLGVRAALSPEGTNTVFQPADWGAISAWAWGLSRALDYLEKDRAVDAKRVAVLGHSRLGKTSLWAGARDQRFAIVISNNSGEGGAALARRWYGETTADLNRRFPHWFCANFRRYNGREDELPVDQHMLLALIAPRPVYVASAEEDLWADPRGEFLAAWHAGPVYELYGRVGLGVTEPPPLNQSVGDFIGYHIRTGKHDVTRFDWEQYLNFADRHFRR
jgi:hypothetical protein